MGPSLRRSDGNPASPEDVSNGRVTHMEPKLITNLSKWRASLFSGCADDMPFVGLCELRRAPRSWLVFCRTCLVELLYDAARGVNVDANRVAAFGTHSPRKLLQ